MMVRRPTRKLGLEVPVEVAEQLKRTSERTMIPQSRLLVLALETLFKEYPEPSGRAAAKPKKSSE
jgi:hypothetical protein